MVHAFKINDCFYLFDVESNNLFRVDELSFSLVNGLSLEKFSLQEINEAKHELEELKNNGLLFTESCNDLDIEKSRFIKSMCLHLSHDCNLRCKYCFADEGAYHGKREHMPLATALASIDFLIAHSGNIKNLEVDFFGGEPLMNFEVLKETVSYAKEQAKTYNKIFKFTTTTNGILLDKQVSDYLNEEMDNVVLSLDGRKDVHDRARPTANGKGSFDIILDKFKYFRRIRKDKSYFLRGTFTKDNLDFCEDVLFMADNFDQVSVEPVVLPEDHKMAISEQDLPILFQQYEKLALEYVKRRRIPEKWFGFFHFNIDLQNGPCIKKRLMGCGAGCSYCAVTPDGNVYPCHQFAGEKSFVLGNVFDKVLDDKKRNIFFDSTLNTKPTCKTCWAKYQCSGGCAANAIHFCGDINKPYALACELLKKRLECALYIYDMEHNFTQN